MASQNITLNGESWTISAPADVTVTDPALNNGVMKISIDYTDASFLNGLAHGIDSVTITPMVNDVESFGFHTPIEIDVKNDMSVSVPGFDLMTFNNTLPVPPFTDNPPGHPDNYAHFHGFSATDFAPETVAGFLPDFSPAGSNPPSEIRATGILAPGQSVSATGLELHSEEHAGEDNTFGISFFMSGSTPTSPAVISGLTTNILRPLNAPDTPFNNGPGATVAVTDPNVFPIEETTITVKDTNGVLSDAAGLLAGAGLTHTGVGTYTIAPTLPTELTAELDALTFTPTTTSATLTLSVDNGSGQIATGSEGVQTPPPVSPNNTIVVTDGPMIVTPQGNWTIQNGQVAFNGTSDQTTHRVVAIGYANGQVWQMNADKNWWVSTAPVEGAWTPGTPPPGIANPTLQVSANNTLLSITDPNQTIIDANQNTWSFVNGGQVSINGNIDPQTGHGVALAYVNGEVWENADNLWWGKTSPTAPWDPPNGTPTSPIVGASVPPQLATAGTIMASADMVGQATPSFLQSNSSTALTASIGLAPADFTTTTLSAADIPLPNTPTTMMMPDPALSMNLFTPPNELTMALPHAA